MIIAQSILLLITLIVAIRLFSLFNREKQKRIALTEEISRYTFYFDLEERIQDFEEDLKDLEENKEEILKDLEKEAETTVRNRLSFLLNEIEKADEELSDLEESIEEYTSELENVLEELNPLRIERDRLIDVFNESNTIDFNKVHEILSMIQLYHYGTSLFSIRISFSKEIGWLLAQDFIVSFYSRYEDSLDKDTFFKVGKRPISEFYLLYGKFLDNN